MSRDPAQIPYSTSHDTMLIMKKCVRGHSWIDSNRYISPKGRNSCRVCRREDSARNRADKTKCMTCGRKLTAKDIGRRCSGCAERARIVGRSEKGKLYRKRATDKLRQQIFNAYGNSCACCKETEQSFLTLDHINGGGTKARKETPYVWGKVRSENFPNTYQLLCWNCNWSKHKLGQCAHTIQQEKLWWSS